jgi:predicted component of type VI protein secretion system
MKVSLVVMNPGKTEGHAIPITLSQFIIGRDPQCNLRPASPVISKRHCAILVKNGKVTLRDFDSTNGTFIDETQVKGEVPLNNDNVLKVGPLTFKVVIEKPVTVDKPTPPPAKKLPGSEDDVGNMLLSLQENEEELPVAEEEAKVPGGSTVMDVQAMPPMTTLAETPPPVSRAAVKSVTPPPQPKSATPPPVQKSITPPPVQKSATPPPPTVEPQPEPVREVYPRPEAKKPEEKKPDEKPKPQHASARDAAKAILEKMYKRPRGG